MPATSNKMIGDFSGKPASNAMYAAIESYALSLGSVTKHLTAQVSFSVNRKFLWVWAYERTSDGTLFLNVRLDARWRIRTSIASTRSVPTGGTTTSSSRRWRPHRATGSGTSFAPVMSSPPVERPSTATQQRHAAGHPLWRPSSWSSGTYLVTEDCVVPQTTGVSQQSCGGKVRPGRRTQFSIQRSPSHTRSTN